MHPLREDGLTPMTNPELETLKIRGGKLEPRALNAVASILRTRMANRLPTLLEFQGPAATLNAVKSVNTANSMLRGRKRIEDVTEHEFAALKKYLEKQGANAERLVIGKDFELWERFGGAFEGYDVVDDVVGESVERVETSLEEMDLGKDQERTKVNRIVPGDPNRIPFDMKGAERSKLVLDKLANPPSPLKHVLVSQVSPLVLGFIPSQFRVSDDQGPRFVMRFEPVIIAEPKTDEQLDRSKAQLIFPPRDRDMLFNAAQVVRKLWTEHLEQNGPELLVSAAGAESVSRVVKMLECANTLQERNNATQFCVRPQVVREAVGTDGRAEDTVGRFHFQFDFYAL